MSDVLAADNVYQWEIEDASNYHPVWLYSLFSYADAAHRPETYTSPMMRYYLEYYTKLIGPSERFPISAMRTGIPRPVHCALWRYLRRGRRSTRTRR